MNYGGILRQTARRRPWHWAAVWHKRFTPDLILFTGGLGASKTAFCEGIAAGLGCTDDVQSPTFAIVNYYRGAAAHGTF